MERKNAALWIYQFAIISFVFSMLTSPYMAAIIAHEDMNIYAYVSIIEVALKLGIVFLLQLILWDKLKLYGILLCAVALVSTTLYRTICIIKYKECKFRFY
jgi:O-antigen/teichoic acid export membrane protein